MSVLGGLSPFFNVLSGSGQGSQQGVSDSTGQTIGSSTSQYTIPGLANNFTGLTNWLGNMYGQQGGNLQQGWNQLQGNVGQGYGQLFNSAMQGANTLGTDAMQNLGNAYGQLWGQQQQGMQDRGLGNTTIQDSVQTGDERAYQQNRNSLLEDIYKQKLNVLSGFGMPALQSQSQLGQAGLGSEQALASQGLGAMGGLGSQLLGLYGQQGIQHNQQQQQTAQQQAQAQQWQQTQNSANASGYGGASGGGGGGTGAGTGTGAAGARPPGVAGNAPDFGNGIVSINPGAGYGMPAGGGGAPSGGGAGYGGVAGGGGGGGANVGGGFFQPPTSPLFSGGGGMSPSGMQELGPNGWQAMMAQMMGNGSKGLPPAIYGAQPQDTGLGDLLGQPLQGPGGLNPGGQDYPPVTAGVNQPPGVAQEQAQGNPSQQPPFPGGMYPSQPRPTGVGSVGSAFGRNQMAFGGGIKAQPANGRDYLLPGARGPARPGVHPFVTGGGGYSRPAMQRIY